MADSEYWALTETADHQQHPDSHSPPIHIPPSFVLPFHKRHISASAASPLHAPIPIINLAPFTVSTSCDLHHACSEWGFFLIINHGVPPALLQQLQSHIDRFLALPAADRCPRPLGNYGQGYGTGFVRFSTGTTEWRDFLRLFTFPPSRRDYSAWPVNPEFRKAIEDFAEEMRALQLRLMGYMSQNLGLRASRLQEIVGDMQQAVLMNHYPPCPQPDLGAGIDNHSDVGAITCIWQQNDVVGLHVFHDDVWIPVEPAPGALIVFVGDQLQIASNGIYKSCVHRAVLNATKRRVSVTSFYQLRPDQVVAPAAELIDDEHPPLYKPTRFANHEAAIKGN